MPALPIEGPFELLRARAFVEGAIAEEAAGLATVEHVALPNGILDRTTDGRHASAAANGFDRDVHCAIAGILGNAVLVRFVGELFDQRIDPFFERLSRHFENDETWGQALAEHRALRDAIAAGDGPAAKAAMRRHIERSQKRLSRNFGEADGSVKPAA